MRKSEKLAAVRRILGHEEFQKNDELIFFCKNPYGCDGRHHNPKLSVNTETESFHCWVCGWKGSSLMKILRLGDEGTYQRYIKQNIRVRGGEPDAGDDREYVVPVLPDEFRTLSVDWKTPYCRDARGYLRGRGVCHRDILRYRLGYCESGEYAHRIIIPSFDAEGELNFFVGRKYYDYVGVAYKHGEFDKDIIFNELMMDWDEPVVLVEGPFDMMIAGSNAIPLQGTILSDESLLFNEIVKRGSAVYIALDADARAKQIKLANLFFVYGVEVHCVELERFGANDVGEMTKEKFAEAKSRARDLNDEVAMLRMKVRA